GHPVSPALEGRVGPRDHLGMRCKSEIVVGAEVQDLAPVLKADDRPLRTCQNALLLVEPRLTHRVEVLLQPGAESSVHRQGQGVVSGSSRDWRGSGRGAASPE